MLRTLTLLIACLASFAAPAAAQGNQARATLYTRASGDRVHAAVVIRINPEWYLYHTDKGHEDAPAKPLVMTFGGEGIRWSEAVLPEPHVKHVDDESGKYFYNYHTGRIVAHAVGTLASGAAGGDVQLALEGLTCTDSTGMCIPYAETVTGKGAGNDKYWTDWPASLGASPLTAVAEPEAPAETTPPPVEGPPATVEPPSDPAGQDEKVSATLFVRIDEEANTAQAAVVLDIVDGWHVYHGPDDADVGGPNAVGTPTVLEVVDETFAVEWGRTRYPKPHRTPPIEGQPDDGSWNWEHSGRVVLLVDGVIVDDTERAEISASLTYQVCDATSCLPPTTIELWPAGAGDDALFAVPTLGKGELSDPNADTGLLWFLLSAVGWGIFTLLMPCTYPMIPITISFFTKQADARGGKVASLSLTYGLGIVAVFILIGLAFAPVINTFATHPVTNIVIGSLFLFFAFVLFGMVNLQPPAALMNLAGKASSTGGYLGVFLMGATLVVTSFTCTAPFVGALLGTAAAGGDVDVMRIVLGMGVFGLTMATPFVLLSLLPGKMQGIPQAGEWMNTLKVFLGFVELAAALKFISNADIRWKWGVLPREVFLIAWFVIFLAAGLYLISKALKARAQGGARGGKQIWAGAVTVAFALYCGYGVPGNALDETVMTALVPNYTNASWAEVNPPRHVVVKDDWEVALQRAREEGKLVLVNFTGFT